MNISERLNQSRLSFSIAITLAINIALAVAITIIAPHLGGFWNNFVYSNCIGWLVIIFIMTGRHLMWPDRLPPPWALATWALFSGAIAWMIGMYIAARLLNHRPFWMLGKELEFLSPGLIMTSIGALGGTILFWSRERVAKLQLSVASEARKTLEAQSQLISAQLSTMQAQLEPHMLFNTLANLRALISQNPPAAQAMLDTLISFLRKTLAANQRNSMPLSEEFALLEEYLKLMKIRMAERLQYELSLEPGCSSFLIPTLLLQPLVENAIKHGIEPALDGGRLSVHASLGSNGLLSIVTTNSMPSEAAASKDIPVGQGYGLKHVQERLQQFFAGQAVFSAQHIDGEFTVTMTVPVKAPS